MRDDDGVCDADEVQGCTDADRLQLRRRPHHRHQQHALHLRGRHLRDVRERRIVDNDADDDGVCDANEVQGCTDPTACNYDADPTTDTDNLLCTYVDGICETCENGLIVDNDTDNDGVCDADEIPGCQDATACNYSASATDSDGNCVFVDGICETCSGETDGTGTIDNDQDDDGVCDANEVEGCTDPTACNYDADPTTDTDNASAPTWTASARTCEDGLIVDNDADDDGVCDANEVEGCTDPTACNYDADPTTDTDNTLCTYVDGICETCENGVIVDNDAGDDGVCDANEVTGCTDATACNYDADPTTNTDNTLCTYVDGICETCEGGLIVDNDQDDDGVCDANEVQGCTDPTACNYDADSTTDTDNRCAHTPLDAETCSGHIDGTGAVIDNDQDDDGVCDADEIEGCTDASACNYDADPTTDTDNALCMCPTGCETCSGQTNGTGTVVDNDADDDGVCDADKWRVVLIQRVRLRRRPDHGHQQLAVHLRDRLRACSGQTDGTGTVVDNDTDDDGVCDTKRAGRLYRHQRMQLRRNANHRHRQLALRLPDRLRNLLRPDRRHRNCGRQRRRR